jgi:hypothetical protein
MAGMTGGPGPERLALEGERVAQAFAASARLAAERGVSLAAVLAGPVFQTLAAAPPGSAAAVEPIARLVQDGLDALRTTAPWGADLLAYEAARLRAAAAPPAEPTAGPSRAPSAQVLDLDWDVVPVVETVHRGEATLPAPRRGPARVLVARAPDGRVTAGPCPDDLLMLLACLDGRQPVAALAARLGRSEADVRTALSQLAALGAVVGDIGAS